MNSVSELPSKHCKERNKAGYLLLGVLIFSKKEDSVTPHFSVSSALIVLRFLCVSFVSVSAELIWNDVLHGSTEKLR